MGSALGEPSGGRRHQGLKFGRLFGEEESEGGEGHHEQRPEVEVSMAGAGHWPIGSKSYLFGSREKCLS